MERLKAIEKVMTEIDKEFGPGSIMKLGANKSINVSVISTGILPIDAILGVGGFPRGRIIEIFGPESSGKTTVALHVIAEAQKTGGFAAFIDAEHAIDPTYAKKIGVDIDNLLISQPDSGEQALEIVERLIKSGHIDVIVIDSVAALTPRAELEGKMGDAHVGLQARLMSQAMRKLSAITNRTKTIVIFINQVREKVGILYGNPEVTTGGRALKFYASVRMEVRKKEPIKIGDAIIGTRTQVKVIKNKVAPPFKEASFDLIYGVGVSKEGSIIDLAVQQNIIVKKGAWYYYKDDNIGQGRENVKEYLNSNPEIAKEIKELIIQSFLLS
ncbi:MAG: recombinase RecA [Clostridiales bacterium]|nr:recombinase RecA [Clostridiales bacterium]